MILRGVEGGADVCQFARDGVEASGGFGAAGEPFVAIVREGNALSRGALGFAQEAVEVSRCVAFGLAGGAHLVAEAGEDFAIAVRWRGGGGGLGRCERLGGGVAFGREALNGFAQGRCAEGQALDILFGADGGFVGLARGAGEFRYVAARGHQRDFRVGELFGGLGALLCGQVARDAGGRDFGDQRCAAGPLFEFFGGRQRRVRGAHETVPAPEIAFAADEALAGQELGDECEALRAFDEAALREAGVQFGRRLDEVAEWRGALGQAGADVAVSAGPVDGRGHIGWRVEIIVERCGDGAFKAGGVDAIHHGRRGGRSQLAQQAVEAFEFGFEFTDFALCGQQRRRQAGFERAGFVDGAESGVEGGLCGLRLGVGLGVARAGSFEGGGQLGRAADRGEFGVGFGEFGNEAAMPLFLALQRGLC